MEYKTRQMTLRDYLNSHQQKISLGPFDISEGDLLELCYFYVHSKSLLLGKIIQVALTNLDAVIFFDMSFSLDFPEIQDEKILKYNIFTAWEFLLYLRSLFSFLKDSKLRVLVVIDSWNTYFWTENSREKLLISQLEKKCWESVFELKEKFSATFIICRKTGYYGQYFFETSFGKFNAVNIAKVEGVKGFGLTDPMIMENSNELLHVLVDQDYTRAWSFQAPFTWKTFEKIELKTGFE
jgi:hypothetical protein